MRFRWNILLVPLSILALAWLSNSVRCTLDFDDLFPMRGRLVAEKHLALLGLSVLAILLAARSHIKR